AVSGYRSLRNLVLPLDRLNVVSGANGSGKSSLYKAIGLLAETAQGGVIGSLAREGGLGSTLWAGPERFSAAMKRGEVPIRCLSIRFAIGAQSQQRRMVQCRTGSRLRPSLQMG